LSDGDADSVTSGDTNYVDTAVEPSVAANPRTAGTSHANLVGVWQQDRWSSGGARGIVAAYSFDGGKTWGETALPFSRCATRSSPFVRASDPWISIGPDGNAYASALTLGPTVNAVVAAVSQDGGKTWGRVRPIITDSTDLYQDDKPSITADPARPGVAYATWNRTRQPIASNHLETWFAETTDWGRTWSTPRQIAPALDTADTIDHQIVVDAKRHALYDVFSEIVGRVQRGGAPPAGADAGTTTNTFIALVRSIDGGRSWSRPRVIARVHPLDPLVDFLYRIDYPGPTAALDSATGKLYVAWAGTRVDLGNRPEIVLSASADGGSHWSAPRPIDGSGGLSAFTPAIGVTRQGVIGVSFYSANQLYAANTDSDPHPPVVLLDAWFTSSRIGGRAFGRQVHLGGPFPYAAAPMANGYFLGDYQGLAVSGQDFHPFFVMTEPGEDRTRSDVFASTVRP
jgi:hypothetical protein